MDALLQALPPTARLVLLGDKDQLASVEAGAVLGDLCRDAVAGRYSTATAQYVQAVTGHSLPTEYLAAGEAPVLAQQTVLLGQSRRFKGAIGQLALAVNRGDAAAARATLADTFALVSALQPSSPQVVCALALGTSGKPSYADALRLVQQGPAAPGGEAHADWVRGVLQAFERFRILCAVHQGDWGTQGLNAAVQKALAQQGLLKPQGEWFAGRPIMVTRNDAQLGVFNGDVGMVLPNPEGKLKAWFLDGEALRSVSVMRLAQLETAFVMTVHKSQGSEFEHTALVLPPGGAEVLSRELVYTGITGPAFGPVVWPSGGARCRSLRRHPHWACLCIRAAAACRARRVSRQGLCPRAVCGFWLCCFCRCWWWLAQEALSRPAPPPGPAGPAWSCV
jgi:exodeoxyribonuclease V alpha subunit